MYFLFHYQMCMITWMPKREWRPTVSMFFCLAEGKMPMHTHGCFSKSFASDFIQWHVSPLPWSSSVRLPYLLWKLLFFPKEHCPKYLLPRYQCVSLHWFCQLMQLYYYYWFCQLMQLYYSSVLNQILWERLTVHKTHRWCVPFCIMGQPTGVLAAPVLVLYMGL